MTGVRWTAGGRVPRRAETSLRIGEVARRAGVGVDTLRFYERQRLIAIPAREPSGYRAYAPDTVRTIRFIREAQGLGFTLKEVAELLRLRSDRHASCEDVRSAARAKLDDVERRITQLRSMRAALRKLVDTCQSDGSVTSCPILGALTDGDAAP